MVLVALKTLPPVSRRMGLPKKGGGLWLRLRRVGLFVVVFRSSAVNGYLAEERGK